MNLNELTQQTTEELAHLADELNIDRASVLRRQELIGAILLKRGEKEVRADGILEVLADGFGFLRSPAANYNAGPEDIYVSPSQIRRFHLRTGDVVVGVVRPPKDSERYFALLRVEEVNSRHPDEQRAKTPFEQLTPTYPEEKFCLEHSEQSETARLVDLFAPLGMGQRCLITAPARAGKSTMVRSLANAIRENHPDVHVLFLVLDARPEEVTDIRRCMSGEVISSTFEEPPTRHIQLAEIALERAKRIAENGGHAVLFVDSLTALCRAHNAVATPGGPSLPGGLDATAISKPKRFFGAARRLEQGGSLTVIATANTGDGAVDRALCEEFTGTANSEIWFHPDLVQQRVFPAIDTSRSSTLRDELLLAAPEREAVARLRGQLSSLSPLEVADDLRERLATHATNAELLQRLR